MERGEISESQFPFLLWFIYESTTKKKASKVITLYERLEYQNEWRVNAETKEKQTRRHFSFEEQPGGGFLVQRNKHAPLISPLE